MFCDPSNARSGGPAPGHEGTHVGTLAQPRDRSALSSPAAACVTASKTSRLTSAVTCAAALLSISTDSGGAGLKPHASVATQPFAHPVLDFRNLSPFCCFLAARRWRALPAACG